MVVFLVNLKVAGSGGKVLMVTLKYLMNLETGWIFGNINPDGIAFNNSTGAYDIDMPPGKYNSDMAT